MSYLVPFCLVFDLQHPLNLPFFGLNSEHRSQSNHQQLPHLSFNNASEWNSLWKTYSSLIYKHRHLISDSLTILFLILLSLLLISYYNFSHLFSNLSPSIYLSNCYTKHSTSILINTFLHTNLIFNSILFLTNSHFLILSQV